MVNVELLNQKIAGSGLKKKYLASRLGLSPYGLALKLCGKHEFTVSEVDVLCKALGITRATERDSIFFAKQVDVASTKEPENGN